MENKEKTYCEIINFIEEGNNFIITTHLSADGDAYGSSLAMAYWLDALGKKYQIVFHDQSMEEKYHYLWGWHKILPYDKNTRQFFERGVVLDVPARKRIGDPAALLPLAENCLKIDHHPQEEHFANYNLVDVAASSTCQLMYEILSRSGIEFTYDLANLLLSGIMYDTGRFSFSNTNQRDFEIAAHLLSFGIKPDHIANNLFFSNDFESLRIVGYGLLNMESHLSGKVCLIYLPLEIMKKAEKSDVDELANFSLAIRGVEVGLFIRQAEKDLVKVSFRSKGNVDVNKVARTFGGGGHMHAAGCRSFENPLILREKIISEIQKQL